VPEAIRHWNAIFGDPFQVAAIPVDARGQVDLAFLEKYAPESLLICTMAVNNETAIVQDLPAIERAIRSSAPEQALWLVDCVQALAKVPLDFSGLSVDYAPFSGHKLYALKGVGFLYFRKSAPLTPMTVGGGQERGLRSGTENLPGVASLGAVFELLERRGSEKRFQDDTQLCAYRRTLEAALREVFPQLEFAARPEDAIPTTLNFAVPGLASRDLLDLFDAAGVRVSSGSACSSGKASRSHVLDAMGLPEWRSLGAVRLSWGLATGADDIECAAQAIRAAGRALSRSCILVSSDDFSEPSSAFDGILQLRHGGANTWVLASSRDRSCVIIDPVAEVSERLVQFVQCQGVTVLAVLDTHSHADHESCGPWLVRELGLRPEGVDGLGWSESATFKIQVYGREVPVLKVGIFPDGKTRGLGRVVTPGHTSDSVSFLWISWSGGVPSTSKDFQIEAIFSGDLVLAGGIGRTDFESSDVHQAFASLRYLDQALSGSVLVCPAHDYENTFATSWGTEKGTASSMLGRVISAPGAAALEALVAEKKTLDQRLLEGRDSVGAILCGVVQAVDPTEQTRLISPGGLHAFLREHPDARVIDVREPHEYGLMKDWSRLGLNTPPQNVPLSRFVNFTSTVLQDASRAAPLVFLCRSGNRSLQAVRSLHRLGVANLWSVSGGFALG
jgi:cysteine sulfinate desulfinase/cysteine desulfurase-like protein/glyoxylase-like metal-dependent hydrolase (beta-lactamase superfamily II)/rhodanese-related sulfurtransferase